MRKKQIQSKNSKDIGVEFLRVLGCLIVIACHCVVAHKFDGVYYFPNTYIATLWADGVGVFWLIAGAFIFKGADAGKKLKNFSVKRLLPAIFAGGGVFYIYDWGTSDTTFFESIKHTKQEYVDLFIGENGLLKLKSPFPQSGHFWYVIVYFLVLLAFPALKGFWDWMVQKHSREKVFLIVSFVALAINDGMKNTTFNFSNDAIPALVPSCIFIIWGAILYKNKASLEQGWLGVVGLLGFFGINLLRTYVLTETNHDHFTYWFTTFGLVASICLFLFCLNVGKMFQKNTGGKVISYISSYTFMIYLVHYGVKDVISHLGIKDKIRELCPPGAPIKVLGYTVMMALTTFTASFILVAILRYAKVGIVNLWNLLHKKKK